MAGTVVTFELVLLDIMVLTKNSDMCGNET